MKIATIVGARPQFIKAAVVSRALLKTGKCDELMIHTGQHYDRNMSEVFFKELDMPTPQFNLCVRSCRQGQQTGRMLEAIERVLLMERPDWCIVYGDTNSTLAGAVAAVKLHVPIVHIEAGLRSFDRRMPEEINRILTDHSADLLFAPTKEASHNLEREGIPRSRIHVVGDVMYDAALYYGRRAEEQSRLIEQLGLSSKQYILATVHRAENTDETQRLHVILKGLAAVAREFPVVLPIHPRTRKALEKSNTLRDVSRCIRVIEPLGYLDMMMLEKHAKLIATDSGGVQKEAFFHRVPCVTFRGSTEWVELVELGWNLLITPLNVATIESGLCAALRSAPDCKDNPYGDGRAAEHIAEILAGSGRDAPITAPSLEVQLETCKPLSGFHSRDAFNSAT